MPTRQHLPRKKQRAAKAVTMKEAAFRRRKQKAVRMAKLEKAAK